MEMFRFDVVKKELTSKIPEFMYPQWMEGTTKGCSLHLHIPCQIQILTSLEGTSTQSAQFMWGKLPVRSASVCVCVLVLW